MLANALFLLGNLARKLLLRFCKLLLNQFLNLHLRHYFALFNLFLLSFHISGRQQVLSYTLRSSIYTQSPLNRQIVK